jgi:GNAT superfamily N-acetyltransferase
MHIEPLTEERLPEAAALLRRMAIAFILHDAAPADAAAFLAEHDEAGLRRNIASGFVYHAALCEGELAGFIGMRERSHVYHLFVDTRRQRQGIARRLWETAQAQALRPGQPGGVPAHFTVNASNYAVAFYTALGFERTAPMQCGRVEYNPMRLTAKPYCAQ